MFKGDKVRLFEDVSVFQFLDVVRAVEEERHWTELGFVVFSRPDMYEDKLSWKVMVAYKEDVKQYTYHHGDGRLAGMERVS